jgi:putative PEP-CTERM system TPR-repeat lipoprotein
MKNIFVLFILFLLVGCGGQSKEELTQEGLRLQNDGNQRGAIVLFKNAIEKDANFLDARLGLASAYLESGNFERAEKEYQKILLQNPTLADLRLKIATIQIQLNSPELALLELDEFHSENDETVESLVLYGRAHGLSRDLESAKDLFNKALSLDAQAIDPRMNLAKVYIQKMDLDRAVNYLEKVISIKKDHIPAYYLLASVKMRQGDRASALNIYQRLLKVDLDQAQALYMSGILQMDMNDYSAAEKTVNTLISSYPSSAQGARLKGILLYRQGSFDDAKVALENSLKQQPHLLGYFFLGLSHYGLNQYEFALNQFQKSLDINPDFDKARVLVSMTLLKQKRLDDAVVEIQKVLKQSPDNAYAHNILGSALLANGDYDKGMAELDLATELDPSLADAHLKKGVFNIARGDSIMGEADLVKAVNAAPEVMNSRLMLVTHYLRQKDFTSAIDLLNKGMDGSKSDALLKNYLAAAYFSQKKMDPAIESLKQAKQLNPSYLTPYFNIASYYASQSQYDLAISEYQQILERDPQNLRALLGMAAIYNVLGDQGEVDGVFTRIADLGTEQGYISAIKYNLRRGDTDAAATIILRGLEKHQSSSQLLELKGLLALRNKEYVDAESAFTLLSGHLPEKGNTMLVRLYLLSGQKEKATQLIENLLVSDNDKEYPYMLSASLLANQKNFDQSQAILEKGITSLKETLRLKMQLARLFERQDQPRKAEQLYLRIAQDSPRFAPAYTSLGFLKERSGDKGEALDLYKKALKYDPKNVPALNNLAYLLADNFGEEKEAVNYAMSAYRLQPSDPRIMDTLGYILVKNERAKEAVNLLVKSHELLPDAIAVALHLAQAKIQLGDSSGARSLLEKVAKGAESEDTIQATKLLKSL